LDTGTACLKFFLERYRTVHRISRGSWWRHIAVSQHAGAPAEDWLHERLRRY